MFYIENIQCLFACDVKHFCVCAPEQLWVCLFLCAAKPLFLPGCVCAAGGRQCVQPLPCCLAGVSPGQLWPLPTLCEMIAMCRGSWPESLPQRQHGQSCSAISCFCFQGSCVWFGRAVGLCVNHWCPHTLSQCVKPSVLCCRQGC